MPACTEAEIELVCFGSRLIQTSFSDGDLSSDGGLLLLRQIDQQPGFEPRCGDVGSGHFPTMLAAA